MMKLTGKISLVCIIQAVRIEFMAPTYLTDIICSMFYEDRALGHERSGFTCAPTAFDESSKFWCP